jgi:ABC-type branched-subunit amino acid transport system substrate-binding protein
VAGATSLVLAACGSSSHSGAPATATTATTTVGGGSPGVTAPPPVKATGTISGPGVTASTITLGQITTTSGPVPGLFQDANDGMDAYVAYLNANGGLAGRTVKLIHMDDALDCNTYTQDINKLAGQVFALIGSFTIEDTCGQATLKANPSLIDLQGAVLSPVLYSFPNVFSPTPLPPGYSTTGYEWIKAKFPNDITKTATLIPGVVQVNGKEQVLTAESIGFKYVYQRTIGPIETNFTSDILRMKSAGVKIVDLGAISVTILADFLQQAHQQGLHLDAVISTPGYDGHLLHLLGNNSIADNLLYAPLSYALYLGQDRASVPELNTFLTWLDRTHPNETASIYSVSAWGAGMLLDQAIAAAGAQITQASVARAIDGITSFNSGGLTATYNPGGRQPAHCSVIAGIVNGQWTRLDPATGFECNGTFHPIPLSVLTG